MYYNKVEICGVNTSDLKVLTDAEKKDLLIRTKNGDKDARSELICGNLRLVLSIIQRFTNRRENMDNVQIIAILTQIRLNFNKFSLSPLKIHIKTKDVRLLFVYVWLTSNSLFVIIF